MGKGDKRSAKGKRSVGSYGNSRPKLKKLVVNKPLGEKKVSAEKSDKKTAVVKKKK